jgi:hypothetical protein
MINIAAEMWNFLYTVGTDSSLCIEKCHRDTQRIHGDTQSRKALAVLNFRTRMVMMIMILYDLICVNPDHHKDPRSVLNRRRRSYFSVHLCEKLRVSLGTKIKNYPCIYTRCRYLKAILFLKSIWICCAVNNSMPSR